MKATWIVSTDTFLAGYARAAEPGQLASLRYAVAGAERVKEPTRELWGKSGAALLEGYGVTETSPVLACNLPQDNRSGTVGRLLPGIEARLETVPGLSEGKRLFVRGPNVMAGYLFCRRPRRHRLPARRLARHRRHRHHRRRLRRHPRPRQALRQAGRRDGVAGRGRDTRLRLVERRPARRPELPRSAQGRAAAAGDRQAEASKDALLAHARKEGFPDLWVPKEILVVPAVPVLASGKIDLQATVEMARQARPAAVDRPSASQCAKLPPRASGRGAATTPRSDREVPLRQALTGGRALTWMVPIKAVRMAGRRGGRQDFPHL